ncbi:solute:sodium symporter (SSS) family transporter [Spizellomyces punctatus DAOM BR117]|uniref:Solute:sodium symporter (SSS) family transporter n=1 Tax=Spizellomyces punctatus (strain DAOM BR117) TaxID=645134 RepID=A0A0L0HTQ0_SPIPD|nr:solute:sodium symporter (SSS) family transporter [Spizellomyces punctatus DAOM BR117]KND04472.1 solute:sodium symporter (SSS) family transporter [Spizellomyces punctatus DAOM BR117]|eukprot:XP_016612511.1 solute:sodium symporter (SSS) family transporter [Spizellomyces punctatus DAOM BR117]
MAVLPQGAGWAVVLGFGVFFSLLITLITYLLKRYMQEEQTSEMFATAGRSMKTGLVACAVVSSWTWAATLLQSSSVAYQYGISGPFWYAAGATIQVLLFAILAIQVKRVAPNAHTFLEIVNARYGKTAHIVFILFGLACNLVVTAMLLLGGSAVVTQLTGMNIYAACMLIPLGVIAYVAFGGLKATFLTDYSHTAVIYIIILVFGFTVYATSEYIGSPGKMFDLLKAAAIRAPVPDNEDGQYLTMTSLQGLIFGLINIVGNFGTVFVDQAYWQRAIAARPSSTVKAYLVGGLAWFAIPFFLATTLGLAAVALESNPIFPTYPERLLIADVHAGLVAPAAAVALLGTSGAAAILILIFMAVTSAASAELVAVSSICTYDIYKTYIKPSATSKDIIKMAHITTVGFGCFMGILAIVLNEIGVSLGYLYLLMGVLLSPAVFPIAFTLTWRKQTATGAIAGAVTGFVCGVSLWLIVTKAYYGEINIDTTGGNYPMLAGNLASLIISGIVSTAVSLYNPDDFDWESTKNLKQLTDTPSEEHILDEKETDPKRLDNAARFAYIWAGGLTVVLVIIWPIPMYLSKYVFSKPFFYGWIVVGLIWAILAAAVVIFLPIWESRSSLVSVFSGMVSDLTGRPRTTPAGHDEIVVQKTVMEKADSSMTM